MLELSELSVWSAVSCVEGARCSLGESGGD